MSVLGHVAKLIEDVMKTKKRIGVFVRCFVGCFCATTLTAVVLFILMGGVKSDIVSMMLALIRMGPSWYLSFWIGCSFLAAIGLTWFFSLNEKEI